MAKYNYAATDRVQDGGVTINKGEPLGSMTVVQKIDPRFAASLVERGATQLHITKGYSKLINDHLCEDGMVLTAGSNIAHIEPVEGVGVMVFAALVASGKAKVVTSTVENSPAPAKSVGKQPDQVAFQKKG